MNENLPFVSTWMELEGIMLSEMMHDITYMWNLKKEITVNITKKNKLTDIEENLVVTSGKREGGRGKRSVEN